MAEGLIPPAKVPSWCPPVWLECAEVLELELVLPRVPRLELMWVPELVSVLVRGARPRLVE